MSLGSFSLEEMQGKYYSFEEKKKLLILYHFGPKNIPFSFPDSSFVTAV